MKQDLTSGNVTKSLLRFAAPLIVGNILQQVYSITDTLIVGRWIGENALAAVGSTYTLTTFLYSVIIGMCMGCGSLISYAHGKKDSQKTKRTASGAFLLILMVTMVIGMGSLVFVKGILHILQTPEHVYAMALGYTRIILLGMIFIFLFNYYAYVLRALGNSMSPMIVLGISTALNIILDIYFVVELGMGVSGAAWATVIAQGVAGILIMVNCLVKEPISRLQISRELLNRELQKEILHMTFGASIQQSVMNFGILMIQGLVNSFGAATMAAFTVAVKIDTLAYMPAQEFANAFSLFISNNYGANQEQRIGEGIKKSFQISTYFCVIISVLVFIFADPLMRIFLQKGATEIAAIGVSYLRVEGVFYAGIGLLFLFYGYFRGVNRPEISLLLTVISLGIRVVLAYTFAPISEIGVYAIWTAIPIGWILADLTGWFLMRQDIRKRKNSIKENI